MSPTHSQAQWEPRIFGFVGVSLSIIYLNLGYDDDENMQRESNIDVLQFKPEPPPPYFPTQSSEILKSSIDQVKKADLEEIESLPEAKVIEMQTVQNPIEEDTNVTIASLEKSLSAERVSDRGKDVIFLVKELSISIA